MKLHGEAPYAQLFVECEMAVTRLTELQAYNAVYHYEAARKIRLKALR